MFSAFDTAPAFKRTNWSANVSFCLASVLFALITLQKLAGATSAINLSLQYGCSQQVRGRK